MSGFSFSSQFNQRWQQTPATVRAAISQELQDIITLLHPDTALVDFEFHQNDLDDHIEYLYIQDIKQKLRASMAAVMPEPIKLASESYDENDYSGLSASQKKLLQSIEASIDDYLVETLSLISKDLKAWVKEEIRQQGNGRQQSNG